MSLRIFCFAMIALGLVAPAANAASINFTMQVFDMSGNPTSGGVLIAPTAANTWTLDPGTPFRVRVFGQVLQPNLTDTARFGTAFDNQPLGIQIAQGNLVSSATNVVNAVNNGGGQWAGFNRRAGTQFSQPAFSNVADIGGDGDIDVQGAGVATTKLALEEPQDDPLPDAAELAYAQVGALGPQALFQGYYVAGASGSTLLDYIVTAANSAQVFSDSASNTTSLIAAPAAWTAVPITININAIPEPSTFALAGMGLVGLVVAYRRRKTA